MGLANHKHIEYDNARAWDLNSRATEVVADLLLDLFERVSGGIYGILTVEFAFLNTAISFCGLLRLGLAGLRL